MKTASLVALLTAAIGIGTAVAPTIAAPTASRAPAASSASSPASADPAVASAEQNLQTVQNQIKAGVAPASAEQDAQIALANAQIQVALARNDAAAVSASLEKIEEARQQQMAYQEQQYRIGVQGQAGVLAAKEAATRALIRSMLYQMVTLEQQKLSISQQLYNEGAASQAELEKAQADIKQALDSFNAAQQ